MLTFSVHELLIWAKVEVRRGGVESTVVDVSGRKEMAILSWEAIVQLNNYSLLNLYAAKLLQSWPTLCDPRDGSPPGSPVPGFLQARTLEWVAISFSNAWKWKVKVKSLSHARLLATPWTAAYQAPPSMGVSRQEYWSGLPVPSPLNLYKALLLGFLLNALLSWFQLTLRNL